MTTNQNPGRGVPPHHICAVILDGPCAMPGQQRHQLQIQSVDDFAVLAATMLRWTLSSADRLFIFDVETATGHAERIDEQEAHLRFAPPCCDLSDGQEPDMPWWLRQASPN